MATKPYTPLGIQYFNPSYIGSNILSKDENLGLELDAIIKKQRDWPSKAVPGRADMDHRKDWTSCQDLLSKALASKAHYEDAMRLFLLQHAAVHTAVITGGQAWSLHDDLLVGLTIEQVRHVPRTGQNSIAWLLWHITRIEDMTINSLALELPQVWDGRWSARLGYSFRDCGAGMNAKVVAELSQRISIPALLDYRAEVGRRTRQTVPSLTPVQAREIVSIGRVQELVDQGSINPKAGWLCEFYTNRTRVFFLTRTATSHNFLHLNEALRLAARLRAN